MTLEAGRAAEDVVVGERLGPLEVNVTRSFVVAAAIATRDYQDVHHDPELAKARGAPDVFVNILTTNGLVGRLVTDWAGPASRLERVAIRLGTPVYPGDTLVLEGTVLKAGEPSDRVKGYACSEIEVSGRTARGEHVRGSVRVALPTAETLRTRGEPLGADPATPSGTDASGPSRGHTRSEQRSTMGGAGRRQP
jgi:acyl dehydratase